MAVPSLALIAQSLKDWTREFLARGGVPDSFVVCSADDVGDISDDDHVGDTYEHGLETDTSVEAIVAWLRRTKDSRRRVVFVTYQSGLKFAEAAREVDLTVDFMILDEAHKTVGAKHKKYAHLIFDENVKASRRMFMTATQRVPQIEDDRVLSMDDVRHLRRAVPPADMQGRGGAENHLRLRDRDHGCVAGGHRRAGAQEQAR